MTWQLTKPFGRSSGSKSEGDEEWRDDPQLIPATICHLTWSLYS
jgi:hypothetical protein